MDKELLLGKIIDAEGNEFELPVENENESQNDIFEMLMELQEDGIIKVGQYFNQGNSINLKAKVLTDSSNVVIPETQLDIIKQNIIENTKEVVSEAFDEMQDEIERLNNKIVELEKQLAER